ncbi:MAG: hypothetical protein V2I27_06470 [Erythrobacter sp.]|nr:hypothetical protein [Erythrobacter sp.]
MEWLFSSGHAADIVLAALGAEAVFLKMRGWTWSQIAAVLGPAALIVLGLRAALVGAAWPWIAAPIAASLPLHLLDLRSRLAVKATRDPQSPSLGTS